MTNEKKLKDLMARMVSMSPQPPEYPEEIEMAQPSNQRRRSPAVIFAVAAAAVLALAIPLALWQGAEETPVGGGTTTVPPVTTTEPWTETTVIESTSTTVPLPVEVAGVVYLIQDPGNSFTGDPALVPFLVTATDDTGVLSNGSAVGLLTKLGELGATLPDGFTTVLPDGVEVTELPSDATLPRVIALDFNERFLDGAGGTLADFTMINQIVYTATQGEPGSRVQFTVNGEPIEAFGTDGLMLLDPIGREDFLTEVNPIILVEPVTVDALGLIKVVGRANVFEANVSYRVTGTDVEGFDTATCGTGCWGDFDFTLNADHVVGGSAIEIFVSSAEDGSPTFVVSIPLSAVLPVREGQSP